MVETDLAKPVADWMRSRGYTVCAEVPLFGRCLDFVGIKGTDVICVELKTSLIRVDIGFSIMLVVIFKVIYVIET